MLVTEQFDLEIAEANLLAPGRSAAPAAATPVVCLKLADAVAEVEKLKEAALAAQSAAEANTEALMDRILNLESASKAVTSTSEGTLTPLAMAQCNVAVQWQASELPKIQAKPDK